MTNVDRAASSHPLVQLILVRYREFFREPEAVFWVFVFPVLLTAGLGIAFRNQAPPETPVAVVGGTPRDGQRTRRRWRRATDITVRVAVGLRGDRGAAGPARSRSWSCPDPAERVEYRYDGAAGEPDRASAGGRRGPARRRGEAIR